MKKFLLFILLPAALLFGAYRIFNPEGDADDGPQLVTVQRGTISVDAVAVGRVEALFEVPVKSTSGGVLTRRFVELGQHVKKRSAHWRSAAGVDRPAAAARRTGIDGGQGIRRRRGRNAPGAEPGWLGVAHSPGQQ